MPSKKQSVFVFGSNLAGRHGKGAALHARKHYGARYGQPRGRQGDSYAIPTKDMNLQTLPLTQIEVYVEDFLDYARRNSDEQFYVTRIGCGLAGYEDSDIAPMFANTPSNCILSDEWTTFLNSRFFE